ncbi:MAG TPA: hypothetical protein VGP07_17990 [Polyangia bacterium]|jgi:hypothetical protein
MTTTTTKSAGIRVKSAIKAGGVGSMNHNATTTKSAGIRVKSAIKAGGVGSMNHNATVRGAA